MLTVHGYLEGSRRLRTAVLVSVPLFALYEAALFLLTPGGVRNAAEVVMKSGLNLHGRTGGLVLNGAILLIFLAFAFVGRERRVPPGVMPLMLAESAAWAGLLAPVTLLLRALTQGRLAMIAAGEVPPTSRLEEVVLSLGAGLYEELLFRLVLIAGGTVILARVFKMDPIWSMVIPLTISSIAFSAFHHLGSWGEPFDGGVFVFRFLAGLLLGALFLARGFGIAAWTHALYDVFCALR